MEESQLAKKPAFHRCFCGVDYECPWCYTKSSFICPTLNGDEDGNMCDDCLKKAAEDMEAYAESQREVS